MAMSAASRLSALISQAAIKSWPFPAARQNLRGKQGRVIIDEAAFVDDLPELLKAALALLMWGGQVIVISTHNGAEKRLQRDSSGCPGRQPALFPASHNALDDALHDGLFRRICRVTKKSLDAGSRGRLAGGTCPQYMAMARMRNFSASRTVRPAHI